LPSAFALLRARSHVLAKQCVDFRHLENRTGVKTRKCVNCPVREATAMLARSAIGAETAFCPIKGERSFTRRPVLPHCHKAIMVKRRGKSTSIDAEGTYKIFRL